MFMLMVEKLVAVQLANKFPVSVEMNICYSVHRSPPLMHSLRQCSPVHIFTPISLIHFNVIPPAVCRFLLCYLLLTFSTQHFIWTNLLTYLLTYILTPWCRILFEKLIVTQLVKKIPLSYGTRRFITVFTKARHWTLT
jgi:hypothetical protein